MNLITKNNIYLSFYLLSWLLISGVHFVILYYIVNVDWQFALIDSLIYNLSFGFLGFSVAYITKYAGNDKRFKFILINHFIASLVFVSVWLLISYILSNIILSVANITVSLNIAEWYPFRVFVGLLLYSVLALLQYVSIYIERIEKQSFIQQRMENTLRSTQLKVLKSQINPHFLFNSLNSISYLVAIDPEKAREMLTVLSEYFRYSIKSKANTSSLGQELENCRKYLEIEKVRFENRLIIKEDIEESALKVTVPAMILQPLYENGIKHGVYESDLPITISTTIKEELEYVSIEILNNYDLEALPRSGEGLGLKNVSERLKLMFDKEGLMHYEKLVDQFSVKITIPK
jgi:sensor histidine kinase YesM